MTRPGGASFIFRALIAILGLCLAAPAQQSGVGRPEDSVETHASASRAAESETPHHRFFDRTNVLLFSGVAVFRGLDYASTRNMQARGREEKLLPDDVVNNSGGFAAVEAGGAAASVGISYILHRTGHHKLERWMSIGHIGVTAFGVARNYSLESMHP